MGPCPLAPSPGQRGHPVPTPQVQAGTWQKQLGTGRPSRRRWPAKRWKGLRPEGVARPGSLLLSPEATSGSRRARGSECRAGDVRRDSDRSWGAGAPEPLRGAGVPKPGPRSARGAQRARGRPHPTPRSLSTQQPRGAMSLRRPGGAHGRLCQWSEGGAPASWKRWGSGDADLPLGAWPVRRIGLPLRTGRGRAAPTRPRGRQAGLLPPGPSRLRRGQNSRARGSRRGRGQGPGAALGGLGGTRSEEAPPSHVPRPAGGWSLAPPGVQWELPSLHLQREGHRLMPSAGDKERQAATAAPPGVAQKGVAGLFRRWPGPGWVYRVAREGEPYQQGPPHCRLRPRKVRTLRPRSW